jgi:hypothetical protein
MTQLAYETEFEAQFLDDQASVFRSEDISAAIEYELTAGAISGHRYVIGFDPAKHGDRSGLVVLDITETPHRAVEVQDIGGREYLRQAGIVRDLAEAYHGASVLLDSTSHDQMVEELKRQGVKAEDYKFTSESKGELTDGLQIALEQRALKIPHHPDLIRELSFYRFQTTAAGNVKLGAPEGAGHYDDLVTALALAVHAGRRRGPVLVSPGSIPKDGPSWHSMMGYDWDRRPHQMDEYGRARPAPARSRRDESPSGVPSVADLSEPSRWR